jgi:dipeptidyl-peptidase-4
MGLDEYFHVVSFDGESTQLSESDGRYTISMNEAAEYYVSRSSSFDRPYAASMHKADGSLIRNLQKMNVEKVMEQGLQAPEQVVFKAADGQTDLVGLVYKPADFDPTKTYPIVLPLYGGPAYQDVTNGYKNADSYQRLAQLGYIVIRANYRGSGNRGKAFATLHYGKLGTLEIDDYAAFVAHISERSYADGARVGVYGHSYGGYATAMLLLRYPNLFHVGVSGAPVTDWRSYDTIYTERYMNTPQANKEGYDIGSAMTYAGQLKGDLLIVHGTTDNNVHPQNSIMLIDALVRADKIFDVMFYPDNRHGIRGAHGAHYNKIRMRYLTERLQPEHAEIFLDSYNWSN